MHRTDADGHVANEFVDGDPGIPTPGTLVAADWLNDVQENICFAIENTPTPTALAKGSPSQLWQAIQDLAARLLGLTNNWTLRNTFLEGVSLAGNHATLAPLSFPLMAAAPSSTLEGQVYYNSTDHKLYVRTNSAWVVVGTQT